MQEEQKTTNDQQRSIPYHEQHKMVGELKELVIQQKILIEEGGKKLNKQVTMIEQIYKDTGQASIFLHIWSIIFALAIIGNIIAIIILTHKPPS